MIDVITVWAPRPGDKAVRKGAQASFEDYLQLMHLQARSARRFGARHRVVSDAPGMETFNVIRAGLPPAFSEAIVAGQIAALEQWDDADHLLLADCDVLFAKDLREAFDGSFDIGLTSRNVPASPVNNGVMYIAAGAREVALSFFRKVAELCQPHWGGDQEAVSKAAAPVHAEGVHERQGARVRFLPCKRYNMTPGVNGVAGKPTFAVHFKGDAKREMKHYAQVYGLA